MDSYTADLSSLSGTKLRQALVERASLFRPLLEKNADKTEADRRVAEENIVAIQAAGLFKIAVPRRFGGLETDIRTMVEVSRELAKSCASTAWVVTLNNSGSRVLGACSAEAQTDVWGNSSDAILFGSTAGVATSRKVSGGTIINGKWLYASGCLHSGWGLITAPMVDESGEVTGPGLALVPASALVIEDTWYSTGLKGSGSNTVVANDVFVPDHRFLSVVAISGPDAPTPFKNEALYRSSAFASLAIALLGSLLGMGSRALEYVIEKASQKNITATIYQTQSSSTGFQISLAKASILIETAHLLSYRAADVIDEAAREGRQFSYPERARLRMDAGHAAESIVKAIDLLMYAHGSSAFAEQCPLQRIWRDAAIASRHAILNPEINAEIYGRTLLGITEPIATLV